MSIEKTDTRALIGEIIIKVNMIFSSLALGFLGIQLLLLIVKVYKIIKTKRQKRRAANNFLKNVSVQNTKVPKQQEKIFRGNNSQILSKKYEMKHVELKTKSTFSSSSSTKVLNADTSLEVSKISNSPFNFKTVKINNNDSFINEQNNSSTMIFNLDNSFQANNPLFRKRVRTNGKINKPVLPIENKLEPVKQQVSEVTNNNLKVRRPEKKADGNFYGLDVVADDSMMKINNPGNFFGQRGIVILKKPHHKKVLRNF